MRALCAAGKWARPGSAACYDCPAGYACSGASKASCAVGTYSPGGKGTCVTCAAGTSCARGGLIKPDPCPSGMKCLDPKKPVAMEKDRWIA